MSLTGLITLDRQPARGAGSIVEPLTEVATVDFALVLQRSQPAPKADASSHLLLQPLAAAAPGPGAAGTSSLMPTADPVQWSWDALSLPVRQPLPDGQLMSPDQPLPVVGQPLPLMGEELPPVLAEAPLLLSGQDLPLEEVPPGMPALLIDAPPEQAASFQATLQTDVAQTAAPPVSAAKALMAETKTPSALPEEEIIPVQDQAPAELLVNSQDATDSFLAPDKIMLLSRPALQSGASQQRVEATDTLAEPVPAATAPTNMEAPHAALLQDALTPDPEEVSLLPAPPQVKTSSKTSYEPAAALEPAERVQAWRQSGVSFPPAPIIDVAVKPVVVPGQLQVFAEQLQAAMSPEPAASQPAHTAGVEEAALPAPRQEQHSTPMRAQLTPAFNPHTFNQTFGHAIDQPQWGESFARHIALLTGQKSSTAEIQLDPPELGSLLVRINVVGDQASISFTSPHLQVRDSIEQNVDRLQNLLNEQGLDLVDVNVSDSAGRQGKQQGGRQEGQASELEESVEMPPVARQVGLVDTYI